MTTDILVSALPASAGSEPGPSATNRSSVNSSDETLTAAHPRTIGWFGATGLAMGGSNQSLFLIGALLAAQGTAAVPLMVVGLLLSLAAVPGWIELCCMYPNRVGGIAATCAEAFRPYSEVLANLTGVCYWWGWVPTCGLCAILSGTAIHEWYLPHVPTTILAILIVSTFAAVNLCGVKWATRIAGPMACGTALLALLSTLVPVWAGHVNWHRASTFHLNSPFHGVFGGLTSAMAGLYLIGFAAPAFEAAACHIGEMKNPVRDFTRAMRATAGLAVLYFVAVPVVWLGALGPKPLIGDLTEALGPTFAPLFGGAAKAFAIWFMIFNMFHCTLQPLSGASRTLSQLSDDALLPRVAGRRNRFDAPWVAILITAAWSIAFLLARDPVWMIAAANLTYLIGITLPSIAVWLLRRHQPERERPYRAKRGRIGLGVVAASIWLTSTIFGFEQFGLPTVLFGTALAYSGSLLYVWRKWSDRRRRGEVRGYRSLHLKLTGAMLTVLTLDGAGYLLAVTHLAKGDAGFATVLADIFVAVALLTIGVGLVLPGMIAHTTRQVSAAAANLADGALADFTRAMDALAAGDLDAAHADVTIVPIVVHSHDEIGQMARTFNTMQGEVGRSASALSVAREQLRSHRDNLGALISVRTVELEEANEQLRAAGDERQNFLKRTVSGSEEERIRLASDLHDGPIQRLAALQLTVDTLSLRLGRNDLNQSEAALESLSDSIGQEVQSLRRLMAELRPPVLDQGGLAAAIRDYCTSFSAQTGCNCIVRSNLELSLPPEAETLLYRVMQEAMTNVRKHALAEKAWVILEVLDGGVQLTVGDDGRGIDRSITSRRELVQGGHFGIANMQERLALINGRFAVSPRQQGGTIVTAWLPVEGAEPKKSECELTKLEVS